MYPVNVDRGPTVCQDTLGDHEGIFQEGGRRGGDLSILTLRIVLLSLRRLAAYTHWMGRQVQGRSTLFFPSRTGILMLQGEPVCTRTVSDRDIHLCVAFVQS